MASCPPPAGRIQYGQQESQWEARRNVFCIKSTPGSACKTEQLLPSREAVLMGECRVPLESGSGPASPRCWQRPVSFEGLPALRKSCFPQRPFPLAQLAPVDLGPILYALLLTVPLNRILMPLGTGTCPPASRVPCWVWQEQEGRRAFSGQPKSNRLLMGGGCSANKQSISGLLLGQEDSGACPLPLRVNQLVESRS